MESTNTTNTGSVLNPAQQEVLGHLRVPPDDRPQFDAGLRHELRAHLESALVPLADQLGGDDTLWVSKHLLSQVHGCQARLLADEAAGFEWSIPTARGTVVHKAVELSVTWRGDPVPLTLVQEATARLQNDDRSLTDFLHRCNEAEMADLEAQATERVTTFLEGFPRLKPGWRPKPEARVRVELCDDRVVLAGRVDLSLGQSQGTTAGKVLIDLKTGGFSPDHIHDLRFYALLETIRFGVPPMKLASYYLDSGRIQPEVVTEALLETATERVIGAIEELVRLRREPSTAIYRPGPACRWCPVSNDCTEGTRWLEGANERDGNWPDRFEVE